MQKILETHEIVKNFGGLTAVNHVSVTVEEGEIFGLIGPNGAGKTTFLNCLAGTYDPTSGQAFFAGENTTGESADTMCRKGMSRTFQIPLPFPDLTVLESVMVGAIFGRDTGDTRPPRERAQDALEFVEFPLPLDTPARRLNAVQLKRLDLARALACGPKLMLLDELASGLTPGELDDMMNLIRAIRDRGITLIVVEHIMRVISGICDRVMVLEYGTKIAEGTTKEVLNNPRVIEAYLGKSEIGH
ncbi:MAG: ABC transporter ATP-binding protein [Anaerolineae bacterium]|jgi:branched-chain amino acid transport system ATP-binding protein